MHIEQDVVDFEMGDTDAKSGPDSIVGNGDDTDIAVDIAEELTHGSQNKRDGVWIAKWSRQWHSQWWSGNKLMEVQFVSDVEIDLFATRGDDECH